MSASTSLLVPPANLASSSSSSPSPSLSPSAAATSSTSNAIPPSPPLFPSRRSMFGPSPNLKRRVEEAQRKDEVRIEMNVERPLIQPVLNPSFLCSPLHLFTLPFPICSFDIFDHTLLSVCYSTSSSVHVFELLCGAAQPLPLLSTINAAPGFALHKTMKFIRFAPKGLLLTVGSDNRIGVWHWSDRKIRHVLSGQRDTIMCMAFHAQRESNLVFTGSADGSVLCYDYLNGTKIGKYAQCSTAVLKIELMEQHDKLIVLLADAVEVWDTKRIERVLTLSLDAGWLSSIHHTSECQSSSVAWLDDQKHHSGGLVCLSLSPDHTHLATCSADATVKLWGALSLRRDYDSAMGTKENVEREEKEKNSIISLHPSEPEAQAVPPLASLAGYRLTLFNTLRHPYPVTSACFSACSRFLFTCCDKLVYVFHVESGRRVWHIGMPTRVAAIQYVYDGVSWKQREQQRREKMQEELKKKVIKMRILNPNKHIPLHISDSTRVHYIGRLFIQCASRLFIVDLGIRYERRMEHVYTDDDDVAAINQVIKQQQFTVTAHTRPVHAPSQHSSTQSPINSNSKSQSKVKSTSHSHADQPSQRVASTARAVPTLHTQSMQLSTVSAQSARVSLPKSFSGTSSIDIASPTKHHTLTRTPLLPPLAFLSTFSPSSLQSILKHFQHFNISPSLIPLLLSSTPSFKPNDIMSALASGNNELYNTIIMKHKIEKVMIKLGYFPVQTNMIEKFEHPQSSPSNPAPSSSTLSNLLSPDFFATIPKFDKGDISDIYNPLYNSTHQDTPSDNELALTNINIKWFNMNGRIMFYKEESHDAKNPAPPPSHSTSSFSSSSSGELLHFSPSSQLAVLARLLQHATSPSTSSPHRDVVKSSSIPTAILYDLLTNLQHKRVPVWDSDGNCSNVDAVQLISTLLRQHERNEVEDPYGGRAVNQHTEESPVNEFNRERPKHKGSLYKGNVLHSATSTSSSAPPLPFSTIVANQILPPLVRKSFLSPRHSTQSQSQSRESSKKSLSSNSSSTHSISTAATRSAHHQSKPSTVDIMLQMNNGDAYHAPIQKMLVEKKSNEEIEELMDRIKSISLHSDPQKLDAILNEIKFEKVEKKKINKKELILDKPVSEGVISSSQSDSAPVSDTQSSDAAHQQAAAVTSTHSEQAAAAQTQPAQHNRAYINKHSLQAIQELKEKILLKEYQNNFYASLLSTVPTLSSLDDQPSLDRVVAGTFSNSSSNTKIKGTLQPNELKIKNNVVEDLKKNKNVRSLIGEKPLMSQSGKSQKINYYIYPTPVDHAAQLNDNAPTSSSSSTSAPLFEFPFSASDIYQISDSNKGINIQFNEARTSHRGNKKGASLSKLSDHDMLDYLSSKADRATRRQEELNRRHKKLVPAASVPPSSLTSSTLASDVQANNTNNDTTSTSQQEQQGEEEAKHMQDDIQQIRTESSTHIHQHTDSSNNSTAEQPLLNPDEDIQSILASI